MRWKLVLGIAGGVVLAVFLAVVVIIGMYDFNDLKPKIRDAVMTATGRQMKIDGDIRLKFSLTPTLSAENGSSYRPRTIRTPPAVLRRVLGRARLRRA